MYKNFKAVYIYPYSINILEELSKLFCFEFKKTGEITNHLGHLQYCYQISDLCFARKTDVDNYILNGKAGNEYTRATILYSLYACNYLRIDDIEYPTYEHWKKKNNGMSLDHKLPRRWFPQWTFDCSNWQAIPYKENKDKGDDFLETGVEKLEKLSLEIKDIKSKYL